MAETIYTPDLTANTLLIQRSFDAPVEKVWQAWTDSEILAQWWAPKPFKAITKTMDFKAGGLWLYYMLGTDGSKFWCRVDFFIIEKLSRFTATSSFCDEEGNKTGELPDMHWESIFTASGTGTKVNVVMTYNSKEDMERIISMGFKEGFAMAHSNLDELLANAKK